MLTPARFHVVDELQNDGDVSESFSGVGAGAFAEDFLLQQEDCVVCLRWKTKEGVSAPTPREQRRNAGREEAIDRAMAAFYSMIY